MKKIIVPFTILIGIVFLINSCSKVDSDASSNTTITIQNIGDIDGNLFNNYVFTSLMLFPNDNSGPPLSISFKATVDTTISVVVKLPKTGSYKLIVGPQDINKYICWTSISLTTGRSIAVFLICKNSSYKLKSTAAGFLPDAGTL